MDTLVIFSVGSQRLGIDGDQVAQILRLPPITPVPLTDAAVRGVCIVDGKVCQVICLAEMMGQPQVDKTDTARLITVNVGQELIGFPADQVLETKPVDPEKLELMEASESFLRGLYHDEAGTVELIELERILETHRVRPFEPFPLKTPLPNKARAQTDTQPQVHAQTAFFLLFRLGQELFAIETHALQELIFAEENIKTLGTADSEVLGVTELRSHLLSVVDLPAVMGFAPFAYNAHARFLVVDSQQHRFALAVDEVLEATEIELNKIERLAFDEAERLQGIVRLEDGRVISLLHPGWLNRLAEQYGIEGGEQTQHTSALTGAEKGNDMIELAVFRVGSESYAFEIEQVREIIRYQPVTPVPDPPPFVEGIINLRGKVIPVVNLPARLGFDFTPGEQSKVVVGLLGDDQVGFLVDEVEDILSIHEEDCTFNEDPEALVHATVTLDGGKRIILWLELEKVLTPPMQAFVKQKEA